MSALHAKIEEILSSEVHLGEFLPKSYLELERMILQVPPSPQLRACVCVCVCGGACYSRESAHP
jgi:hypothetical protein